MRAAAQPRPLTYANLALVRASLVDGIAAGQHAPLGPCLFASADAHRLGGEPLAGAWHNVGTPAQLADVDARLRATDWAAAVPGAGPAPG